MTEEKDKKEKGKKEKGSSQFTIIAMAKPVNIIQINDSVRNPLFGYRQILTRECSQCGKKREYLAKSGENHSHPFQMEICHECCKLPTPSVDGVSGSPLTIEEVVSRAANRIRIWEMPSDATAEELSKAFVEKLTPEEIDILSIPEKADKADS